MVVSSSPAGSSNYSLKTAPYVVVSAMIKGMTHGSFNVTFFLHFHPPLLEPPLSSVTKEGKGNTRRCKTFFILVTFLRF